MSSKALFLSILVPLILSGLAYLISLTMPFPEVPEVVAYFVIGVLAACLTVLLVGEKPANKQKRKQRKPANLLNNGKTEVGNVKWFSTSKGFGFITRDNGEDIFVHFRSITGKGHRALREGQRVEFAISQGNKGLQAEEVNIVK